MFDLPIMIPLKNLNPIASEHEESIPRVMLHELVKLL